MVIYLVNNHIYFLKCRGFEKERKEMIEGLEKIHLEKMETPLSFWSDRYKLKLLLFPCLRNINTEKQDIITDLLINFITKTQRFIKQKLLLDLDCVTHC